MRFILFNQQINKIYGRIFIFILNTYKHFSFLSFFFLKIYLMKFPQIICILIQSDIIWNFHGHRQEVTDIRQINKQIIKNILCLAWQLLDYGRYVKLFDYAVT